MFADRTPREQVILIAALVFFVGLGYFALRHRPLQAEIAAARAQQADAAKQLSGLKVPPAPPVAPAELEAKLAQLNAEVSRLKVEGEQLRNEFAQSGEDVRQLIVEIASVAERHDVVLRESRPYDPGELAAGRVSAQTFSDDAVSENVPPPGAPRRATSPTSGRAATTAKAREKVKEAAAEPLPTKVNHRPGPFIDARSLAAVRGRPLERMTLVGTFRGISNFVAELNSLRYRVSVVQIEVRRDGTSNVVGSPLLSATIVVGL